MFISVYDSLIVYVGLFLGYSNLGRLSLIGINVTI